VNPLAWLAKPAVKYGLFGAAALALAGLVVWVLRDEFAKGHRAGAAGVTGAVQTETIRTVEGARKQKEKAREEVRKTPYDRRVDELE
jgi:uncharacterized membrane protein